MKYTGFDGAAMLLPPAIRENMYTLIKQDRIAAEEIRLRVGHYPTVVLPEGEIPAGNTIISSRDIACVMDIATGASVHSACESIKAGYITARGGYRVGICGTAIMQGKEVVGFHTVTSAAIRIPRQMPGIAMNLMEKLFENGRFLSTLIISPPGCGKTTLLRDIIRTLSFSDNPVRVSLADERGEVAAEFDGTPQMDVGKKTDIMDGCPKAQAAMILLRAMNPQVIAMDEITAPEDIEAIETAANCGVELIATAHGNGPQDLYRRGLDRRLMAAEVFTRAVVICRRGGVRSYTVYRQEDGIWSELREH